MHSLVLLSLLAGLSTQLPTEQEPHYLEARDASPHVINLRREVNPYGEKRLIRRAPTEGLTSVQDNRQLKYFVPVKIGSQTVELELDSGSSDTWVISSQFKCFLDFDSSTGDFLNPQPVSYCNMGKAYTPESTFTPDQELIQLSCYGTASEPHQRCLSGEFGTTPVTLAGIQVQDQLVALSTKSSFPAQGRRIQSGLIGMAFPATTGAYNATDGTQVEYNSIMETMFQVQQYSQPLAKYWTLALSRDKAHNGVGGVLSIGELPKLKSPTVNVSSTSFSSTPITFLSNFSDTEYSLYAIHVDNFKVGSTTKGAKTQLIIDSGAPSIDVPEPVANWINGQWSPEGQLDDYGDTIIDCSAKLKKPFGVTIGGQTFYVQSQDLIQVNPDGSCSSRVYAGEVGNLILGDPFLKNVLAVYDWGKMRMSFYPRQYYQS